MHSKAFGILHFEGIDSKSSGPAYCQHQVHFISVPQAESPCRPFPQGGDSMKINKKYRITLGFVSTYIYFFCFALFAALFVSISAFD